MNTRGDFKMKQVLLSTVTLVIVAACASQQTTTELFDFTSSPSASSITPTSISPQATQLTSLLKPYITATPIAFDISSGDIVKTVDMLFDEEKCAKSDYLIPTPPADASPKSFLGYPIGKPKFIEITDHIDFSKVDIEEIADNVQKTFRAYLVKEAAPTVSCSACIRSAVYIEDQVTNQVYKIDWRGYQPSRVLGRLTWIGNNNLTFFQSIGPHNDELIGIDIDKKEFIYYAGIACY